MPAHSPLAITCGDPAGIGAEIIAKCWQKRHDWGLPPFFVIGAANCFQGDGIPLKAMDDPGQAADIFAAALPILPLAFHGDIAKGQPDQAGAQLAWDALEKAVQLAQSGQCRAMITAPISKFHLQKIGYHWPGQTEFVAEKSGVVADRAVMMLAAHDLRVVPLTIHISLANVPKALTQELIISRIMATHHALRRDFGMANPVLAMAGLNPHAGEQGKMGDEESRIIAPALDVLRQRGVNITPPLPADTLFHAQARQKYDAVICCYHDQALAPLKALYFDEAVNITLGLPIIRTSPDHGTAFDIAGKGIASATSMAEAIKMADIMAKNRAKMAGV